MAKDHGKQIKDDETYEALRKKGYSKEKSARIANAQATGHSSSPTHGEGKYEEWTKAELYQKAQEVGIADRSKMSKQELVNALRDH